MMNKYRIRIAPKGNPSKYRDVTIEAHTRAEAESIIEGMYPSYEIISIT